MSASVIDHERYTVTRSLHIDAPRARVWQAITRPEHISEWFGDTAAFDALEVGASGTFGWHNYGIHPVRIEEFDEPDVFAFTWGVPGEPLLAGNSTTARFTLEDDGDGTLLTVVESGFENLAHPAAMLEDHRGGWDSELDELVAMVAA
jgi:uncharacterized protein YndB with AHSA1/START domain